MLFFNRVEMTGRRLALMVLAVAVAASVAAYFAASQDKSYTSTTYVFTSQLLREDRTDGELKNLVDDVLLAVELDPVAAAVAEETGLELGLDFTILVERATAGGDTIAIEAIASNPENAEIASLAVGRQAVDFVLGQDRARANATQNTNRSAVAEIVARQDVLTAESGGVSPALLIAEAQADLAELINARPAGLAPSLAESTLRTKVAGLAAPSREYQLLDAQLEGYLGSDLGQLDNLSQAEAALAALDSDIVVNDATETKSAAPQLIQSGLAAGLAMAAVAAGFFALIDRAGRRRTAAVGSGQPKTDASPASPAREQAPSASPVREQAAQRPEPTKVRAATKEASAPAGDSRSSPVRRDGAGSPRPARQVEVKEATVGSSRPTTSVKDASDLERANARQHNTSTSDARSRSTKAAPTAASSSNSQPKLKAKPRSASPSASPKTASAKLAGTDDGADESSEVDRQVSEAVSGPPAASKNVSTSSKKNGSTAGKKSTPQRKRL